MDESFKSRVDKVFGSLARSRSSPLWAIGDDEIERRKWRRPVDTSGRDETPCSSSFDHLCNNDRRRRGIADGEDDESRDEDQIAWGIRSSIGMDRTLDFEEEEDEFDKVAEGRENAGDRLYMREVNEVGSFLNSENVLGSKKDPRANHLAAKFRLKEDDNGAEGPDSSGERLNDEARPRPILKRKDNEADLKSRKRVRFNVESQETGRETVLDQATKPGRRPSLVPDYLVNPSKYTRYNLDSSDTVDEPSNHGISDPVSALPRSVTFIPKKRAGEAKAVNDGNDRGKSVHTVGEAEGGTVKVNEEDDAEMHVDGGEADIQKPGRRYRTMSILDDSDI